MDSKLSFLRQAHFDLFQSTKIFKNLDFKKFVSIWMQIVVDVSELISSLEFNTGKKLCHIV